MPGSLVQEEKRLDVAAEPQEKVGESEAEESGGECAGEAAAAAAGGQGAAAAAKKKKKKKKKSAAAAAAAAAKTLGFEPAQDNSALRCLGSWPERKPSQQTVPPTKTMQQLFPAGDFPKGEVQLYASPPHDAEAREAERFDSVNLEALREAAECHRQVRRYAQSLVKPGISLTYLCEEIEKKTETLIAAKGLERGKGFPTGCSLNECAAHYTPNPGEDRILGKGRGGLIEETISSFEFINENQTLKIKPVKNLTGHSIAPYRIHAGKSVPIVKAPAHSVSFLNIMEEGEVYAIETFASTGKGFVSEEGDCSHFMKRFDAGFVPLRLKTTKELLKLIDDVSQTLNPKPSTAQNHQKTPQTRRESAPNSKP
ncbi:methionine aminopeptidase [Eimeria tenella]|uniref:Methionine aminopeptidase n=1 Tax=Eimeria tenella TaxID=5802 RepID=U6L4F8_EIMTE|nr:methionine aminopeptidase [Eimeria tenella]CDJ43469.1 methionine aminopeptidase [Eimeria tenella]|eukprot:XP_013234219.1 methionine aminopeptidase [Eimeria tenella]